MARTRISPAPGAFACSSRSAACLGPSNQRARAFKLFDMTVTFPLSSARTGRAFSIVLTDDVLRDLLRSHHRCKIGADRQSVVNGKSVSVRVDLGGRRIIKKKIERKVNTHDDN